MHEGHGFLAKTLDKILVIFKMTGPAMVRPASWLLESTLSLFIKYYLYYKKKDVKMSFSGIDAQVQEL